MKIEFSNGKTYIITVYQIAKPDLQTKQFKEKKDKREEEIPFLLSTHIKNDEQTTFDLGGRSGLISHYSVF